MEKKLKKCFAIDYSGSTFGNKFYHENVKNILDTKYNNNDDIIIWDHKSKFIPYKEYMEINKKREGDGCTFPKVIFNLFNKDKKGHYSEFILITDGEVSQNEVQECDSKFQSSKNNLIYDYAEVYLIGDKKSTNLSVGCPFTRFCPSKTILK